MGTDADITFHIFQDAIMLTAAADYTPEQRSGAGAKNVSGEASAKLFSQAAHRRCEHHGQGVLRSLRLSYRRRTASRDQ